MRVSIKATNLKLNDELRDYVQKKMDSLEKFAAKNLGATVEIGLISNHHQKGKIYKTEANLRLPGGIVRVEKQAKNLLKSIDKVKDHLKIILVDRKEKNLDKRRRNAKPLNELNDV